MKEKNMPGVMLYFDIRPTVDTLTDAEAGQLLRAILHYGELRTPVSFPDNRVLQVVWNSLEPRIDYERGKYDQIRQKRQKAANARWDKKKQEDANAAFALQTMPYSNSDSYSDSDSNSDSNSNSDSDSYSDADHKSLPSFPPPGRAREELWNETRAKAEQIREQRLAQERRHRGTP